MMKPEDQEITKPTGQRNISPCKVQLSSMPTKLEMFHIHATDADYGNDIDHHPALITEYFAQSHTWRTWTTTVGFNECETVR